MPSRQRTTGGRIALWSRNVSGNEALHIADIHILNNERQNDQGFPLSSSAVKIPQLPQISRDSSLRLAREVRYNRIRCASHRKITIPTSPIPIHWTPCGDIQGDCTESKTRVLGMQKSAQQSSHSPAVTSPFFELVTLIFGL